MNKKNLLYLLIGLIALTLLFLLFFLYNPEENTTKTTKTEYIEKKPNDWENKKYDPKAYDPYGTYIFYNLLRHSTDKIRILKRNSQYRYLDTINKKPRLYVLVTRKFKTHYKRIDKILNFVERGNSAFIAADQFPDKIINIIGSSYDINRSYYKEMDVNFYDTTLSYKKPFRIRYIHRNKNKFRYWTDFQFKTQNDGEEYEEEYEEEEYEEETYEEESYNDSTLREEEYSGDLYNTVYSDTNIRELEYHTLNEHAVFLKIRYGKGTLFLHSLPYTFTNMVMKYEKGMEHAEKVIAHLPELPILYDTYLPRNNGTGGGDDGEPKKRSSPLQFILENRSLRWAYYLLLALLVLYVLFKGKRKQKIVEPKETFENSSVEFADTMSKLYLQYGQHKYLVFQQERNIMNFVRGRYYIHARIADEEFRQKLSLKSGIELNHINSIFDRINSVKKQNHATDHDVVQIHQLIEYFYKNCK